MAVTEITPTELEINTKSADILDADGTVATTPAHGWQINAGGMNGDRLLLKVLADASGDTVVFTQGVRPPSQRADLGATGTEIDDGGLDLTLAASDVRYICVEISRFGDDEGHIHCVCTDAGTSCKAFLLPKIA